MNVNGDENMVTEQEFKKIEKVEQRQIRKALKEARKECDEFHWSWKHLAYWCNVGDCKATLETCDECLTDSNQWDDCTIPEEPDDDDYDLSDNEFNQDF